ncbi:MAG TPA: tryptophan--tRNA ligase [Candidatus Dojkabacteria bacterium]|jgi:tryptophanyl-tRNA synthetase
MKDFSNKTILSGINPSSSLGLHLGNYLGAVKQHVEIQYKAKKALYFIADYHSLNTVFDPEMVRSNVYNTYLDYLSFGLEPEKDNVVFFVESSIPEIAELNLILNNVVTMGELGRMHAYKDKFQSGVTEESINHGLFNYPVLMSADILIFLADIVPVGEDQSQHVEMARVIARHFNNRYGQILKEPEVSVNKETARVIGIDGERKMSKSLGNHIPVFAPEEEVRNQIFAVKTDPARIHPTDSGDPKKNVIFEYMKLLDFDSAKREDFENRYREGRVGDVEIKKAFFEFFMEYFGEMRKKYAEYAADPEKIKNMMKQNNEEAREIAKEVVKNVRKAVGLE